MTANCWAGTIWTFAAARVWFAVGMQARDKLYVRVKATAGAASRALITAVDPITEGERCKSPAACATETPVNIASRKRKTRIIILIAIPYIVTG